MSLPTAAYPLAIQDTPADRQADHLHLRNLAAELRKEAHNLLGYPLNADLNATHLSPLLNIFPNNVGDPSSTDLNDLNTKPHELALINFLATALAAGSADTYGFVAASGTAANLWGLHRGRTRLPTAPCYLSAEAHYAIHHVLDILRMTAIVIPTGPDHAMDPSALSRACAERPGQGAILALTAGTTAYGAYDPVEELIAAASPAGAIHTHVDMALGGWIAPFTGRKTGFDAGADTCAISLNKSMLGLPFTGAAVLARPELITPIPTDTYIGAHDATLVCSRPGNIPLMAWDALRALGRQGLQKRVLTCLKTAAYAEQQLNNLGWNAWRHPDSVTVVFDEPPQDICTHWHLAPIGDNRVHLIAGPHVHPHDQIDALCQALSHHPRQHTTGSR